jgi:bacterioferritin-associated ferredoxin
MYVCLCQGVKESAVREAGASGLTRPKELVQVLGLAEPGCCGRCLRNVRHFVALALEGSGVGSAQEACPS